MIDEYITPRMVEQYSMFLIFGIMFLPVVIIIKKVFQLRGLTWQAYIVALLGFVPVLNIVMLFISRSMVGYKDGITTYILAILAPPTVFIYMFTTLVFEFPVVEKIKAKKREKEKEKYGDVFKPE